MIYIFPCELSYYIEKEIEVVLKCPFLSSLEFALDRFRSDEERFGIGLMAVLTTKSAGILYVGSNALKNAALLGYASPAAVDAAEPRLPHGLHVAGGKEAAGFADFHFFYPDCPYGASEYETLPWPRVRELALAFADSGEWPSEIQWFDRG